MSDTDNDGAYDFKLGGYGFRFATDATHKYQRYTEPTTAQRFDTSNEPGEQSLSPLPWIKSQDSFHGGAGQLNLSSGLSQFQYQQEQVDHIRFDASLGVDVWTAGKVTRLPDTMFTHPSFYARCSVSANVGGVDYLVVGGNQGLCQVKWASGVDSAPTMTDIDLTSPQLGGASNCDIQSMTTDGVNYYALCRITTETTENYVRTYVLKGAIGSTSAPTVLYAVPYDAAAYAPPVRTNYITNPNFESGTTDWTGSYGTETLSQSTDQAWQGTHSLKVVTASTGAGVAAADSTKPAGITIGTTAASPGDVWTFSCYVWLDPSSPAGTHVQPEISFQTSDGSAVYTSGAEFTPTPGEWTRVTASYAAPAGISLVYADVYLFGTGGAVTAYIDGALLERTPGMGSYFDGSSSPAGQNIVYAWTGTTNASTSTASVEYTVTPLSTPGVLSWAKARLMAAFGAAVYELPADGTDNGALPDANYVSPAAGWQVKSISESPTGVLVAGDSSGNAVDIIEMTLDTSGGVPILTGGATVAQLPSGETINAIQAYAGSYLLIGTSKGFRVGTFSSGGGLSIGPLTITTTKPVLAVGGRDRFAYCSYINQQENGFTGLARVDLSYVVDNSGRNAWAADLRPPTTTTYQTGDVVTVGMLPYSGRMYWLGHYGIYVEGNGPGTDGDAWLRTSRIRYDTTTPKLWTTGTVLGDPESAFSVSIARASGATDSHTAVDATTGAFGFDTALDPWVQVTINLGSGATLYSYEVQALPAPLRQNIIICSALCYRQESSRTGRSVTDPSTPRTRWNNVKALEAAGGQHSYVEFINDDPGYTEEYVTIDQIQYEATSPPTKKDDFGGIITFKLRLVNS